ncbi:hypothetical protein CX649_00890 [Bacillaceae bacterium ZC4]|nr:hypothetical protein CX649_00890 [Bacillaceae bacterium ZC4]REJ23015.1 MAG: hypothetical protein C6W54_13305 [Bacillaceae bacterium]
MIADVVLEPNTMIAAECNELMTTPLICETAEQSARLIKNNYELTEIFIYADPVFFYLAKARFLLVIFRITSLLQDK